VFSFCVSTENETENENAKSFSAESESDRNHQKLAFSAPKTKTKFGRTLINVFRHGKVRWRFVSLRCVSYEELYTPVNPIYSMVMLCLLLQRLWAIGHYETRSYSRSTTACLRHLRKVFPAHQKQGTASEKVSEMMFSAVRELPFDHFVAFN